ncbi:MAG: hypothetical protein SGJ11_13470, partial [Phycisphaerae bacterium]|nr:hypothetical protein [Phycisphaerae bacterium]
MTDADPPHSDPAVAPLACGRCGYRTQGLPTMTCPECGFDLAKTPYLRWADRGWLRMIVTGTTLVHVGAIGALAMWFGGRYLLAAVQSMGIPLPGSSRVLKQLIVLGFCITAALGAWMMAAPDPNLAGNESKESRRLIYRILIATTVVLIALRAGLAHLLEPISAAVTSVAALVIGLYVVRGLGDFVRDLLTRAESGVPADATKAGRAPNWIYWVLGITAGLALLRYQGGAAAIAGKIEGSVLFFGFIGVTIALLSLVKASRAIKGELAKATAANSSPTE